MAPIALSPAPAGLIATPLQTSLKRKRYDAEHDEADKTHVPSSPLSSPTKRPKVRFTEDADIVEFDDDKPFDLIREEVRRGLQNHARGDDKEYNKLRNWFAETDSAGEVPNSRLLRKYIVALTGHVRMLDKSCNGLVQVLLNSDWLGRSNEYVAAYVRFLGTLTSAHGAHLHRVLEMLVSKFIHRKWRAAPHCLEQRLTQP
jgi:RNA polymerase I-specific transcription initiation factor RRN3